MSVRGLRIRLKGKVQGVYLRRYILEKALLLGVVGTVRNVSDGSVLCEVVGSDAILEEFVEYCRQGPAAGRVDELHCEEIPISDFDGFKILETIII